MECLFGETDDEQEFMGFDSESEEGRESGADDVVTQSDAVG